MRLYADYAMGCEFQSGCRELRKLGHAKRCAIMAPRRYGGVVTGE
jgi:hypothetical protein